MTLTNDVFGIKMWRWYFYLGNAFINTVKIFLHASHPLCQQQAKFIVSGVIMHNNSLIIYWWGDNLWMTCFHFSLIGFVSQAYYFDEQNNSFTITFTKLWAILKYFRYIKHSKIPSRKNYSINLYFKYRSTFSLS